MTCAKVVVKATLTLADGRVFVGENACNNPQSTCPREPGEGYEKCRSICRQEGHAEDVAIAKAMRQGSLRGAKMHVTHKRICFLCQEALDFYGIEATHDV